MNSPKSSVPGAGSLPAPKTSVFEKLRRAGSLRHYFNEPMQLFIGSSGFILLVAALDRFLIAAGDAQVLSLPEPLLGIPLRYALLLSGGMELGGAAICLFGRDRGMQVMWLAWLGTNVIAFWIGLAVMHCHVQGTCLGSLTDPLRLSRGATGFVVGLLPWYLVLGAYAAAAWLWLEGRRAKAAKYLKVSCAACGVHIRFDQRNLGHRIPCPHCKTPMTLRGPDENLKISCFFCKENIEFPAHALGQKLQCPHCKQDITLKESEAV